ncbi:MAG: polysaccharide deacetylase [Deltaproteobacteria bacterium]|nr:MAG: polysaccharide deacetylase [Deltaproteobacteria bacterium]
MSQWLDPLRRVLDEAPARLAFFFRDDDVGRADERLHPLLDLFSRHAVPIDLAVIPQALAPAVADVLCTRIARASTPIGVHVHGFAHVNHEPAGRKCEFGPARDLAAQRRDLELGRRRVAELLGDAVAPFFTPPWNRCTETTGRLLHELGFRVLSRDAAEPPFGIPGLLEMPVRVDWLRRPSGAPRDLSLVAARLAGAAHDRPAGIMLHHEHMDTEELERLGELLALLGGHARARCCTMESLAAEGRG